MTDFNANAEVVRVLEGGNFGKNLNLLDAGQMAETMRDISKRLEPTVSDSLSPNPIFQKILLSPDPRMAANNLHRFLEIAPDIDAIRVALRKSPEASDIIVALMSGSQFLSDVLISQPDASGWLLDQETLHGARDPDYYQTGAAAVVEGLTERSTQQAALSRWRRREYLRIGSRDLLLIADAEEVSRDISDLAEAIIDQAAKIVFEELSIRFGLPIPESSSWQENDEYKDMELTPKDGFEYSTGMCVLGMGKLGGRELNFSSDIDLVFVYEAEGKTSGREVGGRRVAVISNHDFFTRMGETLVRFLGERGPAGNLFRVDMRLRPEGGDGPLVRSLESIIYYLNTQGRDWERLAYLKARVVSGPVRLSEKLYRVMSEFVFSGWNASRILGEIQSLKMRIDREIINSDVYHREVKRGFGGIREIEFVVASMQIIHGYHHYALRVRNTFLAIQRLVESTILTEESAEFYHRAYSFLRKVEHRLQMAQEAQTHTLPLPGDEFEAMARRCGFPDGAHFQREYDRITKAVHERFTAYFKHDTAAVEQAVRDILVILDRDAKPEEARDALARSGLETPDALRLIHVLAYGTRDVFVSAEGQRSFEQMLPALLRTTAAAPFPEHVLINLNSFALAMKGITYYYEVIAQHPDILRLLVTLFGTSGPLSAQLIAHPEFFDALISSRVLDDPDGDGTARRERMDTVLSVRTPSRRLMLLRRVVAFERLVAALKFLLHIEPLYSCMSRLSQTADHAFDLAVHLSASRLLGKWKNQERPDDNEARELSRRVAENMTILALGKYGGEELNFFGDLDVVFVYDDSADMPDEAKSHYSGNQEFYDAFADVLTNVLTEQIKGGRVFVLDARLRPYGKSSALSTPVSTYHSYLKNEAQTWELQAFHRARSAWGNEEILQTLSHSAKERASLIPRDVLKDDIREMRHRLEESVKPNAGTVEVKRSPGGLTDLEFLIQFQVLSGEIQWTVQNTNYFHVLNQELPPQMSNQEKSELCDAYTFLRQVETMIRLVGGGSGSTLVLESQNARGIAVALGFNNAKSLEEEIQASMRRVRKLYDRTLA